MIYKTYPHVDHRERGVEAVRLLHDVVEVRDRTGPDLTDCRTESINQNQIARTHLPPGSPCNSRECYALPCSTCLVA